MKTVYTVIILEFDVVKKEFVFTDRERAREVYNNLSDIYDDVVFGEHPVDEDIKFMYHVVCNRKNHKNTYEAQIYSETDTNQYFLKLSDSFFDMYYFAKNKKDALAKADSIFDKYCKVAKRYEVMKIDD